MPCGILLQLRLAETVILFILTGRACILILSTHSDSFRHSHLISIITVLHGFRNAPIKFFFVCFVCFFGSQFQWGDRRYMANPDHFLFCYRSRYSNIKKSSTGIPWKRQFFNKVKIKWNTKPCLVIWQVIIIEVLRIRNYPAFSLSFLKFTVSLTRHWLSLFVLPCLDEPVTKTKYAREVNLIQHGWKSVFIVIGFWLLCFILTADSSLLWLTHQQLDVTFAATLTGKEPALCRHGAWLPHRRSHCLCGWHIRDVKIH